MIGLGLEGRSVLPEKLVSLLLVEISEPAANILRIVLLEMSPKGEPVEDIAGIPGIPITPQSDQPAIEIIWSDYILYSVLNESYALFRKDLPPPSRNLDEVADPVLDAFIAKQTFATQEFPGPFKSWTLHSENHVILVTSQSVPLVSRIPVQPEWLARSGPRIFQRT